MLCHMPIVAITSSGAKNARRYVEVMESAGAEVRVLTPNDYTDVETYRLMQDTGGLLLSGGPDIDPALPVRDSAGHDISAVVSRRVPRDFRISAPEFPTRHRI